MRNKAVFPYLHCFWQVAKNQSFTRAAEDLRISQSAVSYQVKQLEDQLGLSLFERQKRSAVRLTPGGRLLADRCQEMFSGLQITLDMLKGKTLTGDLVIAAPTCFGSLILGELISQLHITYPEMRVHLRLADTHVDLQLEQIDMAFRTASRVEGLHTRSLLRIPMRIVASKQYAEQQGLPTRLEELHDHNMLLTNPRDRDWSALREQIPAVPALTGNVTYIDNVWGMLQAIQSGFGMSYLPLYAVDQKIRSGEFVEVLGDTLKDVSMIIYLSTPHKTEDSPKVMAVVDELRTMLESPRFREIFGWLS